MSEPGCNRGDPTLSDVFQFLKASGLEKTLATFRHELSSDSCLRLEGTKTLPSCSSTSAVEEELAGLISVLRRRAAEQQPPPPPPVQRGPGGVPYLRVPAAGAILPFQPATELPALERGIPDTADCSTASMSLRVVFQKNHSGFEKQADFPMVFGSVVADRYSLVRFIGSASFSNCVEAIDLETDRSVCLKIIKNTKGSKDNFDQCAHPPSCDCHHSASSQSRDLTLRRALDEIKILRLVNSHGDADQNAVLRLYDHFYFREHVFVVTEKLGLNLYEQYTQRSGSERYFTSKRLKHVTMQCLKALSFIHGLGLIHCDLKPENIVMRDEASCDVKIIDFGNSQFLGDEFGTYVQSRAYRAPEVIIGAAWERGVDMWSLGCIVAELWTEQVLFDNDSIATLLASQQSIVGPFNPAFLRRGRSSGQYFCETADNDSIFPVYEVDGDSASVLHYISTSLAATLVARGKDIDATAAGQLAAFLHPMLQLDPQIRATASQSLAHQWLIPMK